jgi:hypothetical protein
MFLHNCICVHACNFLQQAQACTRSKLSYVVGKHTLSTHPARFVGGLAAAPTCSLLSFCITYKHDATSASPHYSSKFYFIHKCDVNASSWQSCCSSFRLANWRSALLLHACLAYLMCALGDGIHPCILPYAVAGAATSLSWQQQRLAI